jgi:hypothetical protein
MKKQSFNSEFSTLEFNILVDLTSQPTMLDVVICELFISELTN